MYLNCKIKMKGDRTEYNVSRLNDDTVVLTGYDCGWPYNATYTRQEVIRKFEDGEWEVVGYGN